MDSTREAIIMAIGARAARELTRAYPGACLYVPLRISDDHPIRLAIGQAAEALSQHFGGERIIVPTDCADIWEARDRRAKELSEAGKSNKEIARSLRVSPRTVQRALKRAAP